MEGGWLVSVVRDRPWFGPLWLTFRGLSVLSGECAKMAIHPRFRSLRDPP